MSNAQDMLAEFVEKFTAAAGPNLESIVLYGSASRGDASEKYSDLNLLCVLGDVGGSELSKISPVMTWWSVKQRQRPPLCLSSAELRNSADVFAIEMLDMKANHRVLAGRDLLPEIDVHMNLHRIQVEHDLRTINLRLRQHYLLFPHDEVELQKVLAKSVSSVLTLVRHALIVINESSAWQNKRDLVIHAGKVFQIDVGSILSALDLREDRRLDADIHDVYQKYMRSVGLIIDRVDAAAPKQQLQVVPSSSI